MKKLLIAIAVAFLLVSCGNDKLYDDSVVIPDAKWDNEFMPSFDVNVDDTLTDYTFYLNIRHLDSYRYSNLFIFIRFYVIV